MLVLNAADVRNALPMREAIEAMQQAFRALTEGRAEVPLRCHLTVQPHDGVSLVMPAFVDDPLGQALTVKVVSVFDRNVEKRLPRIQAAVLVLEPDTGRPVALIEGATLTAIRTAAGSGAATELLARSDSRTLAIFGAGVQARTHLEAMCTVRSIETVWMYGPTPSNVAAIIAEMAGQGPIPNDVRAATNPKEAVTDADIICATTTSSVPVFGDVDLKPGVHINAIGAYTPEAHEVPPETVVRSLVVVDSREAAWSEAGDLIQPRDDGLIDVDHIHAELGELVAGIRSGRTDADQITLFKSVGVAVQDAMAARLAFEKARQFGLGQQVSW